MKKAVTAPNYTGEVCGWCEARETWEASYLVQRDDGSTYFVAAKVTDHDASCPIMEELLEGQREDHECGECRRGLHGRVTPSFKCACCGTNLVLVVTNAPEAYDYDFAKRWRGVGSTFGVVTMEEKHARYQCDRYMSGMCVANVFRSADEVRADEEVLRWAEDALLGW